jgi:hypothetical protein
MVLLDRVGLMLLVLLVLGEQHYRVFQEILEFMVAEVEVEAVLVEVLFQRVVQQVLLMVEQVALVLLRIHQALLVVQQ